MRQESNAVARADSGTNNLTNLINSQHLNSNNVRATLRQTTSRESELCAQRRAAGPIHEQRLSIVER